MKIKDEVSVITTSMNYGRYIEDCINSVLDQKTSFPYKMNHIIMDGGSTDDTAERVKKYENKVHFYMNPGEGQTAALNHAMEIIETEFPLTNVIGWINADDLYNPHWLNVSLSTLRKEPANVAMTCGRFNQINVPEELKAKVARMEAMENASELVPYIDIRKEVKGNYILQPTVLIKTSAFKKLRDIYGYYFNPDLHYCQDLDLWIRFLLNGFKIRRLSSRVATLRRHPERMSKTHHNQQIRESVRIRQIATNMLGGRRTPRIAFIWNVMSSHKEGFWENKKDSMQNAIAELSIWHDIRVFVSSNKDKKRQTILGQDITFYKHDEPESLIDYLKEFKPQMLFLNVIGEPLWDRVIKEFPDSWIALVDYGSRTMKIPNPDDIDAVLVQQEYQKKYFIEKNDIDPSKILVNTFCIDANHFKPRPVGKLYTGIILADFRKDIKRQHLIIDAWKKIKGRLLLIGRFNRSIPSSYHKECMEQATNLHVSNRITFMNGCPYDQLPNIISMAKIAYLPSVREGGSRALLEKMACGLPAIVMSDCAGSVNLIKNGVNGYIADPYVEDIVDKTYALLEKYREMGDAASKYVRKDYNYNQMTEFYRDLIHDYKVNEFRVK